MRTAIVGWWALLLIGGVAGSSAAQVGMPGEPVGTSLNVEPVGSKKPKVGKPVGGQVGSGIGDIAGANSQDFSNIDKSRLAAPLPQFLGLGGIPSLWDRTKQSISALYSVINPAPATPAPRPPWVPGIARRNRERVEHKMWRRD